MGDRQKKAGTSSTSAKKTTFATTVSEDLDVPSAEDYAIFINASKKARDEEKMKLEIKKKASTKYPSLTIAIAFNGLSKANMKEEEAYNTTLPPITENGIQSVNDFLRCIAVDLLVTSGNITYDTVANNRRVARWCVKEYIDEMRRAKIETNVALCLVSDCGPYYMTHSAIYSKVAYQICEWKVRSLVKTYESTESNEAIAEAAALASKCDSLSKNIQVNTNTILTKLNLVPINISVGGSFTGFLSEEQLKKGRRILDNARGKGRGGLFDTVADAKKTEKGKEKV